MVLLQRESSVENRSLSCFARQENVGIQSRAGPQASSAMRVNRRKVRCRAEWGKTAKQCRCDTRAMRMQMQEGERMRSDKERELQRFIHPSRGWLDGHEWFFLFNVAPLLSPSKENHLHRGVFGPAPIHRLLHWYFLGPFGALLPAEKGSIGRR
jgi:hypothetical protein